MQTNKKIGFRDTMMDMMRKTATIERSVAMPLLAAMIVLEILATTFINLYVFKYVHFKNIYDISGGLVNATLVVNMCLLLLFVLLGMFVVGKLKPRDVGLKTKHIGPGLIRTFDVWLGLNILNIVIMLILTGRPQMNTNFTTYGVMPVIGAFLAQLLGNALFEEVFFRGFVMIQMIVLIQSVIEKEGSDAKISGKTLWIGMVVSQAVFALMHIPNRIYSGFSLGETILSLVMLFVMGMLFAWLYLVSGNLFLVIGLHTLLNSPTLIFEGVYAYFVVLGVMILMIFGYIIYEGKKRLKETNSL